MATEWLIQNLTASTPAVTMKSLGIHVPMREDVSLAVGRVTFDVPGAALDAAPLFDYGDIIKIIHRDTTGPTDTTWFIGRCTANPRTGEPDGEAHDYEISDPMWYLANLIYQHNWAKPVDPDDPSTTLTTQLRSHLVLGMKQSDGSHLTLSEMLTELNNFLIAADSGGDCPVRISTTVAAGWNLVMPFNEVRAVNCLEVLRFMFRWIPDLGTWIDYSTTPPTIKFARFSSPVTVWGAYEITDLAALKFRARPDLQYDGVVLQYEAINNADGGSWTSVSLDVYPPGTTGLIPGQAVGVIQLAGGSSSLQQQYLKTRTIDYPAGMSGLVNWFNKLPWLWDDSISAVKFEDVLLQDENGDDLAVDYEVIDGAIPEWKATHKVNARATALVSYLVTSADGGVSQVVKKPISVSFLATDLAANAGHTYKNTTTLVTPESQPVGLAQRLYESCATLHYEGSARFESDEVPSAFIRPSNVIAVNSPNEIDGFVQSVETDLFKAVVTVHFGPPQHLGPQDMIELLRIIRGAGLAWSMASRQTGSAPTGGQTTGPRDTKQDSGSGAAGPFSKLVLVDPAHTNRKITLDATTMLIELTDGSKKFSFALSDLGSAEVVQARNTGWCEGGAKTGSLVRAAGS